MNITVVGSSSFLGQALLQENPGWHGVHHADVLQDNSIATKADVIINCALSPALRKQEYSAVHDIDAKIAATALNNDARYIMLSTRAVYGPAQARPLREDDKPHPATPYGRNKLRIEAGLQAALDDRLTVLRLGNIFGFEPGRETFFGRALTRLKETGVIEFDMSAETRRDFLSAPRFAQAITKIIAAPAPGIFNLGSGLATACGDIATWLLEGYCSGRLNVIDDTIRDEFALDMTRARTAFSLEETTGNDIRQDCIAIGQRLKNSVSS